MSFLIVLVGHVSGVMTWHVFLKYQFFKLIYSFTFGHVAWPVGSLFPNQGSNPCAWQWKSQFLTTGLPGDSLPGNVFDLFINLSRVLGIIAVFVHLVVLGSIHINVIMCDKNAKFLVSKLLPSPAANPASPKQPTRARNQCCYSHNWK